MGTIKMKEAVKETATSAATEEKVAEELAEKEFAQENTITEFDDPAVRYEDTEHTDENSRLYYLNNGTAKSVISAVPVNYYDETEKKWKQIDNTFAETADSFVTKAGACKTEIAKAEKSKSVKMSKKDKQISWTYLGKRQSAIMPYALAANPPFAEQEIAPVATELRVESAESKAEQKATSRAVYENIEAQTDLEYVLVGNSLKENIIVKERSEEYRYEFALNTEGLKMRLGEDNAKIELYSETVNAAGETEQKTEFTIPAPYMYDANGVMSEEVYYELDPSADGAYTFAVVADPEWINAADRAMPVTIDPQIVIDSSQFLTKQVQQRSRYYSSSSGYEYTNWKTLSQDNIQVCKTSSSEYKTKLTIKKSAFNMLKNRLASAKLILTPVKPFSGYMRVDGSRKYYSGGNLEINLTSQLKSTSTSNFDIWLEPSSYTSEYIDGYFSMTLFPPRLEVEYFTNEKLKPCEREISLCGAATGILDIPTGEFTPEIATVSGEGLSLPYGITHVFKPSSEDFGLGKNFRLNLHEKLIKAGNGVTDANFVYTDIYGNKHGFKEYFYYLDANNKKVTVDKSSVIISAEGKLSDLSGHEVFKEELSDTGLKAITRLENVIEVELFEQRQEEIRKLEEQVKSYENTLKDFVLINSNGEIKYYFKNYMEDYASFVNMISSGMLPMPENVALQYKSLIYQKNSLEEKCTTSENILPNAQSDVLMQVISLESTCYEITKTVKDYVKHHELIRVIASKVIGVDWKRALEKFKNLPENPSVTDYLDNDIIVPKEDIENLFEDNKEYQDGHENKARGNVLKSQLRQRNLYLEQLYRQYDELEKQQEIVSGQIDAIKKASVQYQEQLGQYYGEYLRLCNLKKLAPVNYLSDGKLIKGFNAVGDLVAVFDSYENAIMIERDEDDRITRVVDNKEKAIVFGYNFAGKLASITDARGRKTKFECPNNLLGKIIYPNGETLELTYSGLGISGISSSNKTSAEIEFKGTQLAKVTVKSGQSAITHGKVTPLTNAQTLTETSVVYGAVQTTVTVAEKTEHEDLKTIELYKFDVTGNLCEYRLEEDGKVTKAEQYEYVKYSKDNVKYAKKDTLDKKDITAFTFTADEYTNVALDDFNNPTSETTGWVIVGYNGTVPTKQKSETAYEYDDEHRVVCETTTVTTQKGTSETTHTAIKTYNYNAQGNVVRSESYIVGEELTNGKSIEETVYDDKGNAIKSFTYNSLDTSSKFYSESEYAENGQVTAEIDETGENKTKLEYIDGTSIVRSQTLPNGSKFAYGHDESDNITAITQSTENGEENSTQTAYTCGEITELRSGNNTVRYSYDHKRRKTAIDLNDTNNYVMFAYEDNIKENGKTARKTTATFVNGDTATTITDLKGNVIKTEFGGITQISVSENETNNTATLTDHITNKTYITAFDSLDRVKSVSGAVAETYTYNDDGNLATKAVTADGKTTEYTYGYKPNVAQELESVTVNGITVMPQSDCLGRNTGKKISIGGKDIAEEHIAYRKVGDHATNMPSAMRFGEMRNNKYVLLDNLKYVYDSCGNISEIRENGKLASKYTYDKLNRLVREDNKQLNKTTLFTYDNNGNILNKREFAFMLKETALLEELDSADFDYGYVGDRLMSFNGEECVYDTLGNPTTYKGKSCLWEKGRQLKQYDTLTFDYDGRGRRIRKGTTNYTYDNSGNLIKQVDGADTLEFFYDHSDVAMVRHTVGSISETYLYRRNAQGDIIALLDKDGAVVVKYVYDAWGNVKILSYDGNELVDHSHIGYINPFRYRGYYYDTETKLYYLKSRYYDPEVGRFITIDDLSYLDPEHINGLNLYAYCLNNPVMHIDPTGRFLLLLFGFLATVAVGGVIGGVVGGVNSVLNGGSFWAGFAGGFVSGVIGTIGIGLAVATGGIGGLAIAGGFGLVGGFAGSVIQQGIDKGWNNIDIGEAIFSGIISGIANMVSFGITNFVMRSTAGIFENIFNSALSFGQRFLNAMNFSLPAALVSLMVSAPVTVMQALIENIINMSKKIKSKMRSRV